MIIGSLALLLNLLAAATLAFFFGIAIICLGYLLPRINWQIFSANARRRMLWSVVLLPWILAVGCLLFLLSSQFSNTSWLHQQLHWHHVQTFNFYSWHSYPSALLLLIGLAVTIQTYQHALNHLQAYRLMRLGLNEDNQIDSAKPLAFSAGFLSPAIFISTGLARNLTEAELDIVQRHEQAHVDCNDSLKKLIFSFFSSFLPQAVAKRYREAMSLCIEQCADQAVVQQGKKAADVAQVLVKVTKLTQAYAARSDHADNTAPYYCAFTGEQLTARIHYLVLPQPNRSASVAAISMILAVALTACLFSLDLFHHIIEILFQH